MNESHLCYNCGLCCATQGTPPFSGVEGDSPPAELDWDVEAHADRYDEGLPCLWLDTESKICKHYEHRPVACREAVIPGDEYCNSYRKEGGLIPLLVIPGQLITKETDND